MGEGGGVLCDYSYNVGHVFLKSVSWDQGGIDRRGCILFCGGHHCMDLVLDSL
jgi:hypothetical protein